MSISDYWEKWDSKSGQYHLLPKYCTYENELAACGQVSLRNDGWTKIPGSPTCSACLSAVRGSPAHTLAVPVDSAPADRREVILSLLPSDAVFLTDYATGSLRGPACKGYVGSVWAAGVFDPRDTWASEYRGRDKRPVDLSYTVPVAERLAEPSPGTVVAALVDEVMRLRAALARKDGQ